MDFADKVFGDGDLDIVAEVGFLAVVAMHAVGRFGIRGAAETIRPLVIGGTWSDLGRGWIFGWHQHNFIGHDLVQIHEPFERGRALLGGQERCRIELGANQACTLQGRPHDGLQTRGTFAGGEMKFTPFVFRAEEGRRVQLGADRGFACGVYFRHGGEQALAGMPQQLHHRFLRRVGAERVGVPDLRVLPFVGEVRINLAQELIKEGAMLLVTHPQLEPFESAVVGSQVKERIADKPFDHQVEAEMPFQVAQRPVVEILHQERSHETGHRMDRRASWPFGMMIASTSRFERGQLQVVREFHQQMVGAALEQFGVGSVTEPLEQRLEIRDE